MENKTKLECCPFCGGDVITQNYTDNFVAFNCRKCGAVTSFAYNYSDLDNSINAWNKRASDYDIDYLSTINRL